MEVFVNEMIVILLRGIFPKANLEMTGNQQYAKTGRWEKFRREGDGKW